MKKKTNTILIFTVDGDLSTDKVIDWLALKGYEVIRYNTDTDYLNNSITYELNRNSIEKGITIGKNNIEVNELKSVWVRKYINPNFSINLKLDKCGDVDTKDVYKHLTREYSNGVFALVELLNETKKVLGSKITNQPSKYKMLLNAKKFGLKVPNTLITTKKKDVLDFLKINREIVTKPLKEVELFVKTDSNSNKIFASTYTELLGEYEVNKMSNFFFMSLFQEKLNKKFEIRTFYLNKKFYSSAIFSQLDNQTDVDFRMYNDRKPNRVVPYELPKEIEEKLILFMDSLGLITGSIDLIKTVDSKYVFLEVNPWGQYGMVGNPCNYSLNKKIAEFLTN